MNYYAENPKITLRVSIGVGMGKYQWIFRENYSGSHTRKSSGGTLEFRATNDSRIYIGRYIQRA